MDDWLEMAKNHLINVWGLSTSFAGDAAKLLYYFYAYNLNPVITSGFRSPARQKELRNQYLSGYGSAIVAPAQNSLHSKMFLFRPASKAIDIKTNNSSFAAQIAKYLNIGSGYYFRVPDPVHFYQSRG